MSNNINFGGKFYEEIDVNCLNDFLHNCELASHQDYHSVPAIIFNSEDMSFKGFHTPVTISRGLNGGLFTISITKNGISEHEEFYAEAELFYRVFVPKNYLRSLRKSVV